MNCERPFNAHRAKVEDGAGETAQSKPECSGTAKNAAAPLQAAPDEKIVAEPATTEELLPWYKGERYFSVWDISIGRWAGTSIEWEEAIALMREGRLRLKKQE